MPNTVHWMQWRQNAEVILCVYYLCYILHIMFNVFYYSLLKICHFSRRFPIFLEFSEVCLRFWDLGAKFWGSDLNSGILEQILEVCLDFQNWECPKFQDLDP